MQVGGVLFCRETKWVSFFNSEFGLFDIINIVDECKVDDSTMVWILFKTSAYHSSQSMGSSVESPRATQSSNHKAAKFCELVSPNSVFLERKSRNGY
jgi:hypothetical protein